MENRMHRRTPWNTLGGRVISLVSRKGGVGKTTSAVNLGAALALSGHTVLVVGTDPQCGVCRSLGCPPEELPGCLSDIFDKGASLTDLAEPSTLHDLFFVSPRILSLRDEDAFLDLMDRRADEFVRVIDRARNFFDTILIDCPPSLGPATRASLMASDSYLVPVQAEELCRDSLGHLFDFVESFSNLDYPGHDTKPCAPFTKPLTVEGLFLTMANHRTIIGKHVANRVAEDYRGLLFETSIPRNTRLSEMPLKGKPIVIFDRRSSGSRAYFDLADEMVKRYYLSREGGENELPPELVGEFSQPLEVALHTPERINMVANSIAGLDSFLTELEENKQVTSSIPSFDKPKEPEMASLDDFLPEEKNQFPAMTEEGWDDGYCPYGSSENDCMN